MRTPANTCILLLLAGSLTATLLAKPPAHPGGVPGGPDDPAIHWTPTPAPGSPGSAPVNGMSDAQWTYQATYKKSAKSFKILCYDGGHRLQATIEISGLQSTDAPGRLPKTAHPSISLGTARYTDGVFTFKGPAPRAGAIYRFETSNPDPKQHWSISGDAKLQILP